MAVFDPSTLHRLVDDASGRPFVLDLARTYCRLMGDRVTRIRAAVSTSGVAFDPVEALDAVLSLKVSSSMTGVDEVAEICAVIVEALRCDDLPAARAEIADLGRAATQAERTISSYLDGAA